MRFDKGDIIRITEEERAYFAPGMEKYHGALAEVLAASGGLVAIKPFLKDESFWSFNEEDVELVCKSQDKLRVGSVAKVCSMKGVVTYVYNDSSVNLVLEDGSAEYAEVGEYQLTGEYIDEIRDILERLER